MSAKTALMGVFPGQRQDAGADSDAGLPESLVFQSGIVSINAGACYEVSGKSFRINNLQNACGGGTGIRTLGRGKRPTRGGLRRLEVGGRRHGLQYRHPRTSEALPMTLRRISVAALFIAAIVLAACATEPPPAATRSAPADGDTMPPPLLLVRVWFNEATDLEHSALTLEGSRRQHSAGRRAFDGRGRLDGVRRRLDAPGRLRAHVDRRRRLGGDRGGPLHGVTHVSRLIRNPCARNGPA